MTKNATVNERRTLYEGRIFTVDVDRVELPSGHTVNMEIIRHPGSVVLLPMPSPNEIILIRQYRYSIDQWIWELPAGSLKPDEDPAAAAARECEEEVGLTPARVERLRSYYPTPGFCNEEMIFYRCTDLRPPAADSSAKRDEDEELEPRTFTLREARTLVETGNIVDLKTAVGLAVLLDRPQNDHGDAE
jgi:ADP-ribose pyrophosphatase